MTNTQTKKIPKDWTETTLNEVVELIIDHRGKTPKKLGGDWSDSGYSVKEIAQFLKFSWRDVSPSGALSIQWFNDFIATGDESIKQRILDYNEDDCRAMLVIKKGIERLNSK